MIHITYFMICIMIQVDAVLCYSQLYVKLVLGSAAHLSVSLGSRTEMRANPSLKPGTTTSASCGFSSADIHPCTNDIWYQVSPVIMLWWSAEIALMATFYDLISKPFRVLICKLIRLVVFYWTSMVCSMTQYCFYISNSLLKESRPLKIRICWHDVKRWNAAVE